MSSELKKVITKWVIALTIGIIVAIETKQIGLAYLGASVVFGFSYMIGGIKNIGWLGAMLDIFAGGGPIGTVMGAFLGFAIGSFIGPFIGIYELILALAGNDWSKTKKERAKKERKRKKLETAEGSTEDEIIEDRIYDEETVDEKIVSEEPVTKKSIIEKSVTIGHSAKETKKVKMGLKTTFKPKTEETVEVTSHSSPSADDKSGFFSSAGDL